MRNIPQGPADQDVVIDADPADGDGDSAESDGGGALTPVKDVESKDFD